MRTYYPAFLDLEHKKALVIGGGSVALRKAKALLKAKARVYAVSPAFNRGFTALAKRRKITLTARPFRPADLKDASLVICATDNARLNASISKKARQKGVLANVADDARHSNFILPSFFSRGPLTIAVSTSGISPSLSKRIRLNLQKRFGGEYAVFLKRMKRLRPGIIKKFPDAKIRKKAFSKLVDDFINS